MLQKNLVPPAFPSMYRPHYFMSLSRIKDRGPDSVAAQGWFHIIQKSFLLVTCVDKHRNI